MSQGQMTKRCFAGCEERVTAFLAGENATGDALDGLLLASGSASG